MTNTVSVVDLQSLDQLVGERVHQLMWRKKIAQSTLGSLLGIGQSGVSKKLRGQSAWTVEDLYTAAGLLGVEPTDLLPRLDSNQQPSGYTGSQVSDLHSVVQGPWRSTIEQGEQAA